MTSYPEWLAAAIASDAAEGRGVLPGEIRSLAADVHVVGPARVLLLSRDDNLSLRAAMDAPVAGSVLVAAGGSASRTAMMGGLMALEMRNLGFLGIVTDGLVRDVREIRELGLGVWCRGLSPAAPQKDGPVLVGEPVAIGGVVVHDGDLVIADDDGVVVWPRARIPELLTRAEAKYHADNERLARLQGKG